MPIRVEGESCRYELQAAEKHAGKRVECPATLRVPPPASTSDVVELS